jgi:CheY-like chemotaxis protein
MNEFDPSVHAAGYANRFHSFQDLMQVRVHDILLVSSVYDSFILEEDGRLEEGLINEFMDLNLVQLPRMMRASTGSMALSMIKEGKSFDLIITTMRLGDMDAREFALAVRAAGNDIPIVLLSYDYKELKELMRRQGVAEFEHALLWQGDFRILLAAVKLIEDRKNVEFDTNLVGVQSILMIEDNVRYYSSFLPIVYTELMRHSQEVLADSLNQSHRILRMRARPKILLCHTYEEAWAYFLAYHDNILGVISDIRYPRHGKPDRSAGVEFARNVRSVHPDIPILLQSSDIDKARIAEEIGVSFLQKNSPLLLEELRRFLVEHLSFGDFIFRGPDGEEVCRADDLRSLELALNEIPDDCLLFHSRGNHFSNWLKARTEFWLAHQLRPRRVEDYASTDELRNDLINRLRDFRLSQQRGVIVDFDPDTFGDAASFARIGGGSLGGKGRGLAFVNMLLENYAVTDLFDGVSVEVPSAVVLGTNAFDGFLAENGLRDLAVNSNDETEIEQRFLKAPLPERYVEELRRFVDHVRYPIAVRSSSLLEDSQHQPFAGIYGTWMLANNREDDAARLDDLLNAIRLVYASTFSKKAKAYMRATAYRPEEEKMAVVIQKLVGNQHEDRFYPDFAGVARSHNFYPSAPMSSEDGIASVALGLGLQVVDGGATLRFCPKYPRHVLQFSSVDDTLAYSQREFIALDTSAGAEVGKACFKLGHHDLKTAERDGVLNSLASTYSPENDAIYEGLSRPGIRIVSFAPILKSEIFPLPDILQFLLMMGRWSMSTAVEIEFAVNLRVPPGTRKQFRLLQMRPMVISHETEEVVTRGVPRQKLVCESSQVLGNGVIKDVSDVIMVKVEDFDRSKTKQVAQEIARLNYLLMQEGRPFLLFGVGRWGSSDPWLGIPVTWDDIAGAAAIIESSFRDLRVEPSQGTHFFQNLATMRVGYFTIDPLSDKTAFVDWEWLAAAPAIADTRYARHIRFERPLSVKMDGQTNHGIIERPRPETEDPADGGSSSSWF